MDAPGAACPDCGRVTGRRSANRIITSGCRRLARTCSSRSSRASCSIQPETRRNEVLTFVRGGLKDCRSRGRALRGAFRCPSAAKWQNHVIYVWLDALANYMTAIGYGSEDPQTASSRSTGRRICTWSGKEIIRFHCVYWPAFLMAAEIPLPKSVVANGWLLFEESKMSKSQAGIWCGRRRFSMRSARGL